MRRRLFITSIGVLLCVIGFFSLSSAQVNGGSFSVTPQVGGYRFDNEQNMEHGFTAGVGVGYNFTKNIGTEFTFNFIKTAWSWNGSQSNWSPVNAKANGYMYRWDGLYHIKPEKKLVPYAAAGIGGLALDAGRWYPIDKSFILNYGGGVKYFLKDNLALRGDIRHVFSTTNTYNNIIYTVGLHLFTTGKVRATPPVQTPVVAAKPAEPDSDGDGVVDSKDACPNTPKGVVVNSSGCPLDADGDGVYDYLDKCPDTPKGVKVNSSGCPLDTDGDGVYDYLDKCSDTPKGVKVNSSGCPLDTDGDGVYDYLDKCPDTPKGVKVNNSGCPLDTDGDGVYDYLDKCPDTARDLKVDAQGCPILMKKKQTMSLDIQFDTDKAVIKPEYNDRLKEFADFMTKYPEITAVIEGHTDNVGGATYNMKLSQRRAVSVRDYLIKKLSIKEDRLTAKGFGKTTPVASNDTEEGRSKNRRIQAVVTAETETYEKR